MPAPIDVARARQETPGCASVVHLNNAGAALVPQPVLDAVLDHVRLEARTGAYEAAAAEAEKLDRPYPAAARLLGCSPGEIAVMESATRAWQAAFAAVRLQEGDRILTSAAEYGSNYMLLLRAARKTGVEIEVVPDDHHGQLSIDALEDLIDERVKLIALTHVPSNGGLVNPAAAVGRVARRHGITYLLDACQSVGQLPVDVEAIGCDLLCTTSRKYLRGPRGAGLLYARHSSLGSSLEPAFPDMRSAAWVAPDRYVLEEGARRFEAFEINHAAKIGLGVALDYALSWGIENIANRIAHLAGRLRAGLDSLDGVMVRDLGAERCGIVSLTVEGREPEEVRRQLAGAGVNVWVSPASSTRLDMDRRGLTSVVRASVHYYNTEEELDRCCELVAAMAGSRPSDQRIRSRSSDVTTLPSA